MSETAKNAEKPSFFTWEQHRQNLFQAAKELLPDEKRLQACFVATKECKPVWGQYSAEADKARFTNYCFCQYPFLCPNCGPYIAEKKRQIARADLSVWFGEGFTACWMVNTLQHLKPEPLIDVDRRLKGAIREMWRSQDGLAFAKKWRIVGRTHGPDYTYGENGHHVHRNTILFLERRHLSVDREVPEFTDKLKQLWVKYCAKVGGYADFDLGCVVSFDRVFDFADYMTSKAAGCGYGGTDKREEKSNGQKWGIAEEMTKHEFKTHSKGKTQTDLLNGYLVYGAEAAILRALGEDEAAAEVQAKVDEYTGVFQEFAAVFKRKHFYDTPTRGFRKRLEELKSKPVYAEMLAKEPMPEFANVCAPGPEARRQMAEMHLQLIARSTLKRVKGDPARMREFFEEWGITQVYYPELDLDYPDWWVVLEGLTLGEIRNFNVFMAEWNSTLKQEASC